MVKRIFVEKKPNFNIEASRLLYDIKNTLGFTGAENARIIHCYDTQGLDGDLYYTCIDTVFSQPSMDTATTTLQFPESAFVFGKRLLPGQYDQCADSAEQCIQVITGISPTVMYTKIYIITGQLSPVEKAAIEKYCINPIDSQSVGLEVPETLDITLPHPKNIENISITQKSDDEILQMHRTLGLAMNTDDLLFIRDYFRDQEQREPTETEIAVIDTYWSDHCRHSTFLTKIQDVTIHDGAYRPLFEQTYQHYLSVRKEIYGEQERPISLMDLAVIGMKALRKDGLLPDLDESEEINACSIVINVDVDGTPEEWLLMFKNETHNHPTEMEPFGGASTCLGGAIRDPLSGRSYVYQAMRVTGSGDPRQPISETLENKLPQRVITTTAAHGYSSYGNQIGLATGHVSEIYHEGYVAKRMEVGALVGAVKKENVVRQRPKPGDVVLLVGGRTGRDGIGGATGSSKEHDADSLETCGAEVQKGNPITERKLQRLFRNPAAAKLILRCNDFGAGGVSVAIGELADSLEINLDNVRKKYEGLNGTELALSESQERMAVVVDAADADRFIALAEEENLEAYQVAVITDTGRLIMKWRGTPIVNISRKFLDTSGVMQKTSVAVTSPPPKPLCDKPFSKQAWLDNLSDLNVASQKGLVEMFDSTVGSGTVLSPLGGKHQLTPAQVMAAKIPVPRGTTNTASVMSYGFDPYISAWSPYHGAAHAVVESVSRLVAAGVDYRSARLSFQEYFERLRDDATWGKPFAALLGAFEAQIALGTASIGGKDSMSGTFQDLHVPPTLISFAVGTAKVGNIISPEFKQAGNTVALLKTPLNEYDLPDYNALRQNYDLLQGLIAEGRVISAHAIGFGGVAAAVAKMAFGNAIGVAIDYADAMFTPMVGSFVLEISGNRDDITNNNLKIIGKTTDADFVINGVKIGLTESLNAWTQPLESVFPTDVSAADSAPAKSFAPFVAKNVLVAKHKIAKPKVFLPVFPGTNCEWDVASKFEEAGAQADIFVMKNLTPAQLRESVEEMAKRIKQSQILAIPGGFSAGDEPEGSGKYIAAVLMSPAIADAISDLMDKREGLMVGICNGFQALIHLGLVPFGRISPMTAGSPTLTYNSIGRHISVLPTTKIVSTKSPWFANVGIGDLHRAAASHGQGRFVASDDLIKQLFEKGQVAAVYTDHNGNVANSTPHNPNGSMYAIEAITSYDGRILGKMCHSERIGNSLYKNVPGNYEQHVFKSGVQYFC